MPTSAGRSWMAEILPLCGSALGREAPAQGMIGIKGIAPEGAPTEAGSPYPVFCTPCDTPLMLATSACSSASSCRSLSRQRFSRSACITLIGSI